MKNVEWELGRPFAVSDNGLADVLWVFVAEATSKDILHTSHRVAWIGCAREAYTLRDVVKDKYKKWSR